MVYQIWNMRFGLIHFSLCFNCLSFISFSVPAFNVSRLFLGEFLVLNDQFLLRLLDFKAMAPYICQR